MKPVKIMLTAIILLGTVGGILAHKLKRNDVFCTTATKNGTCTHNPTCGFRVMGQVGSGSPRCTAPLVNDNCPVRCSSYDLTQSLED